MLRRLFAAGVAVFAAGLAPTVRADGPKDNLPGSVRPIPPPGIEVPGDRKAKLEAGLAELDRAIAGLEQQPEPAKALRPDVVIFRKAVHDALTYGEFFAPADLDRADRAVAAGLERAKQLAAGEAPWTTQTGLVVRGYVSKIDGSVQPYGLVVPESYTARTAGKYRLDVWFHGRGETLSEVNFLDQRMRQPGEFTPADTIVLHPYGRYCNAFKFAGEVDVYEALDDVRAHYRVDDDRIAVRGFSMGGAACWQFAVHDAGRWFAANPGAGFAETPLFLKVFQREQVEPTWYEQALWNLYDCPGYAVNLRQCPTVAYSGEIDAQKQAADVMTEALAKVGIPLTHIIGPQTAHKYHPEAKAEVGRRLEALAVRGRERVPATVAFATYTLRYNRMNWVTIDALGEHWKPALVTAHSIPTREVVPSLMGSMSGPPVPEVTVHVENVTALSLEFGPGEAPFAMGRPVQVLVGGVPVEGPPVASDRSWRASFHHDGERWTLGERPGDEPRKRHGLQGPIDDAFMDSFMFVMPSKPSAHPEVATWVESESKRAVDRWRKQFRGQARVKADVDVTEADIASANLVLWGDPAGNAVLGRIAEKLPIGWNGEAVSVGDRGFEAAHHVPILVCPNPLNPARYVVVNSGFTYREYDDLNNARQVPKLPDWAVLDVRTPPDSRSPGKVVAADFFDEAWRLRAGSR